MCDDEVRVLVFKPNISQSEVAFNPTSYHQQNPLQPEKKVPLDAYNAAILDEVAVLPEI